MESKTTLLQTQSEVIDGTEYTVTQFTGREAIKIKLKLMKIFSPLVPLLADLMSEGVNLDSKIDSNKIVGILSSFFEQLPEDEFMSFILRMLANTRCHNKMIDASFFDIHFAGKLLTVYKVLYFVIKVNYPDFFQAGGNIGSSIELFKSQSMKEGLKEQI